MRYGLFVAGRPVAALQMARWRDGDGFRPSELDLLARTGPTLARGLDRLLRPSTRGEDVAGPRPPPSGYLTFDDRRGVAYGDRAGMAWLERLPDDGPVSRHLRAPVVIQSCVSWLRAEGDGTVLLHNADRYGLAVTVSGTVPEPIGARNGPRHFHIGVSAARLTIVGSLTPRQRQVADALAEGPSDAAIAARLGIAASTVHDHVARLHVITGINTCGSLVANLAASRTGWGHG